SEERPALADGDEADVGKPVDAVEGGAEAAADLGPRRAAVGGLDDEAAAVAEVAGEGVGEGGAGAAEEARARAGRGERLGPREPAVGGVEQVAGVVGGGDGTGG